MGTTVHNITGFVHKGSGGMSLVFPDVCKTPTPGGPVPIPYPNLGKASDANGTKSVKADGKTIMVKGKSYVMTSLDEPGSVGGVISGTVKGKAEFLTYSFNVMIEGKNVCRMSDMLWHNKKNICG